MPIIRILCIQVVKDVGIVGYFPKPKVVREQELSGKTSLVLTYSVK